MECLICKNNLFENVLDRKPSHIWTGAGDDCSAHRSMFECKLFQCLKCGHIQQNITRELEDVLARTYTSTNAQLSTTVGRGPWGMKRAQQIFDELNINDLGSVLEIGCANGYLLEYLKKRGCGDLMGVEPSIDCDRTTNGIKYIKAFANFELELGRKFDLMIAICVLEHVKNVNDVMRFAWKHLNDEGRFFIEVPNHRLDLENGDPKVFVHEHIHYFTENSLRVLFGNHGLRIENIKKVRDSYFVHGQKDDISGTTNADIILHSGYDLKLERTLKRIAEIANRSEVAFHGVNNSLSNILSWIDLKEDFVLFDNDEVKIGEKYFGKVVSLPSKDIVKSLDHIVVVPTVYADEIREQYMELGFKGQIFDVISN